MPVTEEISTPFERPLKCSWRLLLMIHGCGLALLVSKKFSVFQRGHLGARQPVFSYYKYLAILRSYHRLLTYSPTFSKKSFPPIQHLLHTIRRESFLIPTTSSPIMKIFRILVGLGLVSCGLSAVQFKGEKVKPFLETLNNIATASENLQVAIKEWDGQALHTGSIMGNSSELANQLKAGIERVQNARRIHAASELKLSKPSKRTAEITFNTLQLMVDNYRRFYEAMATPTVRNNLDAQKELSAQLNEAMRSKFGPVARRITKKGGRKTTMWFDEALEIFAKHADKKPEEDQKRRAEHPKWKHIQPPAEDPKSRK